MEVKILNCDTPNGNKRIYPLNVVKKCVKEFNKRKEDDSLRNVYFNRIEDPSPLDSVLGKVKKLKVKDKTLYAEFEFGDNEFAKSAKELYEECMSKGVSSSHFDYRIMMDCMGKLVNGDEYFKVKNLEVYQFCFGLDSSWRRMNNAY